MTRTRLFGSRAYFNRRTRDLEARYGGARGTFIITACRVAYGWGIIPEAAWPRDKADRTLDDTTPEPPGLDALAAKKRTACYVRITNVDDARRCIAAGVGFQAAFPVSTAWYAADRGHISRELPAAPFVSTHAIAFYDYNDRKQAFRFANTWGKRWGVGGIGSMSYEYFEQHVVEAWSSFLSSDPYLYRDVQDGIAFWGRHTPLGPVHGIEILDDFLDRRIAWVLMRATEGALLLEDLFVRPEYRRNGFGRWLLGKAVESANSDLAAPVVAPIAKIDRIQHWPAIEPLLSAAGLKMVQSPLRSIDLLATNIRWPLTRGIVPGSFHGDRRR